MVHNVSGSCIPANTPFARCCCDISLQVVARVLIRRKCFSHNMSKDNSYSPAVDTNHQSSAALLGVWKFAF